MFTRRRMIFGGVAFARHLFSSGSSLAQPGSAFHADFAAIEAATGGRLGVMLTEYGSGRSFAYRGTERFPMCSTAKVLVCGAVLARVDIGKESLDRRIRFVSSELQAFSPATKAHVGEAGMTVGSLCDAALTLSDNTAMNLLTASVGGPAGVTQFARSLGDATTRLDRTETALNEAIPGDLRDTTTPEAMASTLSSLVLGSVLSFGSRHLLEKWMVANTTGDAKLRAGVPKAWRVGDKTGSGDHGTSNDIGILWRGSLPAICAIVYLTSAETISESARAAASAAVGQIARRAFSA